MEERKKEDGKGEQIYFQHLKINLSPFPFNNLTLLGANPLVLMLEIPEEWCGEQSQLKVRMIVQPGIVEAPLKVNEKYLLYSISLRFLSKNYSIKGVASIDFRRTPLKWTEIKPERLDA